MIAFGLDRTRSGWVMLSLVDGRFERCEVIPTVEHAPSGGVVGIDMPMWHPPPGARRVSELAARRILGPRASTVFLTPPADALTADWDHARSQGVSKQMWNLAPSMAEVARHRRPEWIEVHPEVVFASLAGRPLAPKKTWTGVMQRRHHLAAAGVRLPDDLGPAGLVPTDDILDAAACALVAARYPDATVALGEGDDLIHTVAGC